MMRLVLAAVLFLILPSSGVSAAAPYDYPGCRDYPATEHSPTGVAGCVAYGVGTASWWGGDSAARNDCEYPWVGCVPVTVTSLTTGVTIAVTPAMYCGCYLGDADPENDRLIDLTRDQLRELGLDPADGLFSVAVRPAEPTWCTFPDGCQLPDTAIP